MPENKTIERIELKNITKSVLQEKCNNCRNYTQILTELGLVVSGSTLKTLKRKIKEFNIIYMALPGSEKGRSINNKKDIKELVSRKQLKKRIIKNNLLEYKCQECGLKNIWNNKKISLQLDHINGINDDNRLENLRFLCPNCHSQTDTFGCKRFKKEPNKCIDCKKCITYNSKRCVVCFRQHNKEYILQKTKQKLIIDRQILEKLVWEKPIKEIAVIYKVSNVAIKKRCKKFKINTPPRGYWRKKVY